MLVDLERNDLGRICQPGTVEVEALMELASYAHVHHIESSVAGQVEAWGHGMGRHPGAVSRWNDNRLPQGQDHGNHPRT